METPAGPVDRLPTRKATALLAQLALDPRPHQRDALQLEYWPDRPPAQARVSLRQTLSMIRRVLPDPRLLISDEREVELQGVQTDVAEFQRLSQKAVGAPESDRAAVLEQALAMYSKPLPGWTEPWVDDLRGELAADAIDLSIQLAGLLASTDRSAALHWVGKALEIDPEDEEALALQRELRDAPVGALRVRRRPWPAMEREMAASGAEELERRIQACFDEDRDQAIELLSSNVDGLSSLGYRRVLPLYRQATVLTTRDSEHFGRLNGTLGHIYHRLGAYRHSTEILRDVVEWSRGRGDTQTEAQALIALGLMGLEQGHISPSHPTIGRLWEINRRAPKESAGAYVYTIEGAHRWHGGEVEKGWQFVREAVRRASGEGLDRMARWNFANMSIVSWERGAIEAMQEFRVMGEQAAAIYGDRYLSYAFAYIVGAELLAQGHFEESVEQLRPLVGDPRRDFSRLHILLNEALGLAAASAGQVELAIEALARAYVRRRTMGHLPTVTERRQLRRAYSVLEDRVGTGELDRMLDLAIEACELQRRNGASA
jgi:DNA-binding SARP family transcriptional activator